MSIIKKVMTFVMGVVVIGIVVTTIGVVTRPSTVEKSVTFDILDNDTYTPNVFNKVVLYSVTDNDDYVTNIRSIKVNNIDETLNSTIVLSQNAFAIFLASGDGTDNFVNDGSFLIEDGVFQFDDEVSIIFNVEVETPVFIKTLLLLIPLVLSASVIGYLVIKDGKE